METTAKIYTVPFEPNSTRCVVDLPVETIIHQAMVDGVNVCISCSVPVETANSQEKAGRQLVLRSPGPAMGTEDMDYLGTVRVGVTWFQVFEDLAGVAPDYPPG